MLAKFIAVFIFLFSMYSTTFGDDPTSGLGLELEPKMKEMLTNWLQYTKDCLKEAETAGKPMEFPTCMKLYTEPGDDTKDEYSSCKCGTFCVARKIGSINQEGNGFNETNIKEIIDMIDTKYQGFASEFNADVWPKCKSVEGNGGCAFTYNYVKCVFENSDKARSFRDLFFAVLKMKYEQYLEEEKQKKASK